MRSNVRSDCGLLAFPEGTAKPTRIKATPWKGLYGVFFFFYSSSDTLQNTAFYEEQTQTAFFVRKSAFGSRACKTRVMTQDGTTWSVRREKEREEWAGSVVIHIPGDQCFFLLSFLLSLSFALFFFLPGASAVHVRLHANFQFPSLPFGGYKASQAC